MNTSPNQEKRRHIRFPSSRPVIMIDGVKSIYATMTDFSRHGIGFITTEKPSLESMIEIHFDIPKAHNSKEVCPYQFKALVKHCISFSKQNHIGVRIELPSEDYLTLFDSLNRHH